MMGQKLRPSWSRIASAGLPAAIALAGCVGTIGDGGGGAGASSSNPPAGASSDGPKPGAATPPAGPSPDTPLRRLTRAEYLNSLRDLLFLSSTADVADALPVDATSAGFDNDAETLKIDDFTLDKYDGAASALVDRALGQGSASRAKIVTCDPASGDAACLRAVLGAFAGRAWRRPTTSDEITALVTVLDDAKAQGEGFDAALALGLRAALLSPSFLYRVEIDPPGAAGMHPVGPFELATRLSYFLWSSTPDDELLARAGDGTLGKADVLASQMQRMLDDHKADALLDNFAGQWLGTGALTTAGVIKPDPSVFPSFDEDLRAAMASESRLFFREFLKGDRNVADMLDADFTFANARLATHYGLAGVTGTEMQRVALAGTHRLGLLSQASVLALTSLPTRTSPTRRGKWVLSRLLCSPPPPPPANVPALDQTPAGLPPNASIRQMMEAHRKDPNCAGCHAVMDPIGFGLEHYDAIGAWRDAYPTSAIDATGELPGGLKFDGAAELARLLKNDPRILPCVTKTLFAYALGREPTAPGDLAAVDGLTRTFQTRGGRLKELVLALASSDAFQLRGGQP